MTESGASQELTHFDEAGNAVMVDVTEKAITRRRAEAHCWIRGLDDFDEVLREKDHAEVLTVARVAGVFGAKKTSSLIPLCHPLPLSSIEVLFVLENDSIEIIAAVETESQTGVEMEALSACGVTALSIASQLGPRNAGLLIDGLELLVKSGGRSGLWMRVSSEAKTTSR
ncbi:MAG TPA: cyclic pyranopterin monophosphate synthase MoaC [Acidimicrobiales bacterium]|nr:cyclic pyranopterin monophosphate synthase MoaC [Acidimicrobiales bacterium]